MTTVFGCFECLDGKVDPTELYGEGVPCRDVGFPGHPGVCHLSNGVRVILTKPAETVGPNTPVIGKLYNWNGLVVVR